MQENLELMAMVNKGYGYLANLTLTIEWSLSIQRLTTFNKEKEKERRVVAVYISQHKEFSSFSFVENRTRIKNLL